MRGVGQTRNMIYNLPDERCMVVTYSRDSGRSIEQSISDLRGKDFSKKVKVTSISSHQDLNKLMGYSHLIFFDHAFFDLVEEDLAKEALNFAEGASIVYHHKKGNLK